MSKIDLIEGDNRISMRRLIDQGVLVHSVVTDPPYGLVSIQKRFGKEGAAAAKTEKNDGSFARLSGGFMGKEWDGTGIERDPEFWKLVYEILLPGGFCFAFSGSRTGHWQACAMEMAGFIMHPMHGWVFGTGFPKGHDPKLEGWEGWAYGTQTQKPALEPIYLAQKPFSEKTGAANLLQHGVGALNIDGCRVTAAGGTDLGRYPSNLILDGSDEVVAMFPTGTSGKPGVRRKVAESLAMSGDLGLNGRTEVGYADSGSTARFFHRFPLEADPIFYSGKAGKLDRAGSKHPTVKPIALMRYLIRHVTPPGGIVLDPFAGSGTTGVAALDEGFDCILMEAEVEYAEFLRNRFELQNTTSATTKNQTPVHLDNGATSDFIDLLGDDFFDLTA